MKKKADPLISKERYYLFDSLRGFALILMAIYHFCFDLNFFGVLQQNMNHDPFWLNFRAVIMSSFLSLVGVSFVLSKIDYETKGFKDRLLKVGGCAALISVGTYFANPQTWIFFGVLHFIFIASLLGPLLLRLGYWNLPLAGFFIILPVFYRSHTFTDFPLILSGLSPIKPITEDFSPLFPWLGAVCLGIVVAKFLVSKNFLFLKKEMPQLTFLGQHSLIFYMVHQAALYPLAWVISKL